jgi:hypothetical protein
MSRPTGSSLRAGDTYLPWNLLISIVKQILFLLLTIASCESALALDAPKAEPTRPVNLTPAEAEAQGRALVADLLARKPEPLTNTGVLRIRGADRLQREIGVKFQVADSPGGVVTVYEALGTAGTEGYSKLTIVHSGRSTSTYSLVEDAKGADGNTRERELSGDATMIPFAGSDFWVADLGLEFLHWPKQLLLRKEMRRSRPCDVLESTHPQPAIGYSRVVSWIDIESAGILHADAYDANGNLLKQFDPTELQKVGSERQVREIEMRNRQTGSRSAIEFYLGDVK